MSKITFPKPNKFFFAFIAVLIVMSALFVVTLSRVLKTVLTAYEIKPEEVNTEVRIDKEKLDDAYNWVFHKEEVSLNPIK